MIKKLENKIDKFCQSEYTTKRKSDSQVKEPMSVKESLNKFKESITKLNETIDEEKFEAKNNLLQPINPQIEFNPLFNDNAKECYHNVAHQIYIKIYLSLKSEGKINANEHFDNFIKQ